MMERTLAGKLADLGFISALGTVERTGGTLRADSWPGNEIEADTTNTGRYDHNNGVTVVYDDRGIPWVRKGYFTQVELTWLGLDSKRCGAHVPHSNDGGAWVTKYLTTSALV